VTPTKTSHDIALDKSSICIPISANKKHGNIRAIRAVPLVVGTMADTESAIDDSIGGASDGAILERRLTNTESDAIRHPGDVRINVKGAFIVDEDEEPSTPGEDFDTDGYQHDRKDIRLPNHKAVVSHMAVDVCSINILSPHH
jgi:hypothetical protein